MEASWLNLVFFRVRLLARHRNLVTNWREGSKLEPRVAFFEDDGMHPVHRAIFAAAREIFFAFDSTCNNIADEWILFGEVRGEIHLLPFESLSDSESGKPKIGSNSGSLDKVKKAIYTKDKR